jgi:hypothetical protein
MTPAGPKFATENVGHASMSAFLKIYKFRVAETAQRM